MPLPSYKDQEIPKKKRKPALTSSRRIIRPVGKPKIRVKLLAEKFNSLDSERRERMVYWTYAMLFIDGYRSSDPIPDNVVSLLQPVIAGLEEMTGVSGVNQAFHRIMKFAISHADAIESGEVGQWQCESWLKGTVRSMRNRVSEQKRLTDETANRNRRMGE